MWGTRSHGPVSCPALGGLRPEPPGALSCITRPQILYHNPGLRDTLCHMDRKTEVIHIRITPEELAALDRARGGVSRSVWARAALFNSYSRSTPPPRALSAVKEVHTEPVGTCRHGKLSDYCQFCG